MELQHQSSTTKWYGIRWLRFGLSLSSFYFFRCWLLLFSLCFYLYLYTYLRSLAYIGIQRVECKRCIQNRSVLNSRTEKERASLLRVLNHSHSESERAVHLWIQIKRKARKWGQTAEHNHLMLAPIKKVKMVFYVVVVVVFILRSIHLIKSKIAGIKKAHTPKHTHRMMERNKKANAKGMVRKGKPFQQTNNNGL